MKVITTNDSEIKLRRHDLENHLGFLPFKILEVLGRKSCRNYEKFLKEQGKYEEWENYLIKSKNYSYEEEMEELEEWVNKYPEFKDLVRYVPKPSEKDLEETKKILGWI